MLVLINIECCYCNALVQHIIDEGEINNVFFASMNSPIATKLAKEQGIELTQSNNLIVIEQKITYSDVDAFFVLANKTKTYKMSIMLLRIIYQKKIRSQIFNLLFLFSSFFSKKSTHSEFCLNTKKLGNLNILS